MPFEDGIYEEIFNASSFIQKVFKNFEEYAYKITDEKSFEFPGKLSIFFNLIYLEKPLTWDRYAYSHFSLKNRKPKMEDRHIILPSFDVIDYKNVSMNVKKLCYKHNHIYIDFEKRFIFCGF